MLCGGFWEFVLGIFGFFGGFWQFAGPGSQEEVWGATSFYASYLYLPSHLFSPCLLVGDRTIPPFFIPAGGEVGTVATTKRLDL